MKKLTKTSELMWILGMIFVALGVSLCSKANLGVSMIAAPAFILSEAIKPLNSFFTVGVTEYIFQGLLLIILCLIIRKFSWKFLFTFATGVIYGYTLDLILFILRNISFNTVLSRWIMLILGDVCTAFGVACFFRTYLPLCVYEFFVAKFSSVFKKNVNKVKWAFDISLLIISLTLTITLFNDFSTFDWTTIYFNSFHSIGLGTILTTIINSPIIMFFGKILDKLTESTPLIPKLKNFFS